MSHSENKIVILGCGWLGQIVGETFSKRGAKVYGSYRREEVNKTLLNKGIEGFALDFNEELTLPAKILNEATHVLVFIPPSSAKTRSYPELLVKLLEQFPKEVKVVFSSSTGVYPKEAGTYDEQFELDPTIPNRLLPAELALKQLRKKHLTILRLSGLIGPGRHPAYSLSGKEMKDDGSNPVNLIHSLDIVNAIVCLFENDYFGATYNLCTPEHPSKKDYYTEAAKHFQIAPPVFGEKLAVTRLVLGNRIERETSFRYNHVLDNFDDFLR
ncbi:MAG: SDR family oxidoreductase [Crocinitomicaceae bacterium]